MNPIFEEAKKLQEKMTHYRRDLHQIPEVGMDLPKTKAYIKDVLEGLGLEVKEYGQSGLSAVIQGSKPGKTLLLRADMDALPMEEDNDLDFASKEDRAHMCGHDIHSSILLGAAEILLNHKEDLSGRVKLMFQPGEEIFQGSKMMVEEGLLEDPKVDAALALHTDLSREPGALAYTNGYMTSSSDNFKISIQGKGGHGAYPHLATDPLNAAVQAYQNFSQLVARENPPTETTTLTLGQLSGGNSGNVIPDSALLQGTMRTFNPKVRDYMKGRMEEILAGIEKTSGCTIKLDYVAQTPSVHNHEDLTKAMVDIVKTHFKEVELIPDQRFMASEDMGFISEQVPTLYMGLTCKVPGNDYAHHNPKVLFNEEAMPYGAAYFALGAIHWLAQEEN